MNLLAAIPSSPVQALIILDSWDTQANMHLLHRHMRLSKRTVGMGVVLLAVIGTLLLTATPTAAQKAVERSDPASLSLLRRRAPSKEVIPSRPDALSDQPSGSAPAAAIAAVAEPEPALEDLFSEDQVDGEEELSSEQPTPAPSGQKILPVATPTLPSKSAEQHNESAPLSDPEDGGDEDSAAADRRSLLTSSLMIVVSEIGDKTFLVAASAYHP